MKKLFASEFIRIALAIVLVLGFPNLTRAAGNKDAHVTQVIRDVRLMASKTGSRPAAINDRVQEGQAVRTGGDSRAELTFTNQSITRLGSNTVFNYGQGAKELNLSSGAALIVVPKEAGSVMINTAAATAAVTGFTALVESHNKAANKFMIIEGQACVKNKFGSGPCVTLNAGDMLIIQPGTRNLPAVQKFDIKKTVNTALLLKNLGKLPKWAQADIAAAIAGQDTGGNPPPGGGKDPTGVSTVDQKTNASQPSPPRIVPPPGPPPGN